VLNSFIIIFLYILINDNLKNIIKDNRIYNLLFNSRGSKNRVKILMSLTTPKTRQDIAKELGIDWKEVDKNLRILIKSNLMKIIYENSKTKRYGLTSYGESIVNIIKNIRNLKEKGSYKEKH